jgi:hypothetical protein
VGLTTVEDAGDKMELLGDRKIAASMQIWLGLSPLAKQKKLVA